MASYKFRKNGKVQITITRGKRYDGKPQRYHREVDYVSDKKLEEDAALFLADIINGNVSCGDSTVLNALYSDYIKHNGGLGVELKLSTLRRYETLYSNQIKEHLGNRKINSISRVDVRDWIQNLSENGCNKLTGKPLAPKTIKNALSLLSTLYIYAIEDLGIVENNPCDHVKVPKAGKKYKIEKDFYNEEEVIRMIELLQDEREDAEHSLVHATVVLILLFTGMRNGEVMGLKWSDIDLENNMLKIRETRQRVPKEGAITDTPKTQGSVREVTFPQIIHEYLIDLKSYQDKCKIMAGDDYTETGYVVTNVYGQPQEPTNTYRWFKRFLKRHNLRDSTIHDLRHTHAAMLSSIGVQIIDVSKRLGHTNTRVTQEVYEYLFKNNDKEISHKLDEFIKTKM